MTSSAVLAFSFSFSIVFYFLVLVSFQFSSFFVFVLVFVNENHTVQTLVELQSNILARFTTVSSAQCDEMTLTSQTIRHLRVFLSTSTRQPHRLYTTSHDKTFIEPSYQQMTDCIARCLLLVSIQWLSLTVGKAPWPAPSLGLHPICTTSPIEIKSTLLWYCIVSVVSSWHGLRHCDICLWLFPVIQSTVCPWTP